MRIIRLGFILSCFCFSFSCLFGVADDQAKSKQELEQMLKIFPQSGAWSEWLEKSRELPPDFDTLPSIPFLPDPLRFQNGIEVKTPEQWRERRNELLQMLHHYVIGTVPPPPGNVRVAEMNTQEEGVTLQKLVLEFGPDHKAQLHVELIIPKGKGPFPVFLTQDNHRSWALVAVSRGYIGCVYAGADSADDTAAFIPLWPNQDWTKLARRAWAASRCIDYLYTLPVVNRSQIAITGHSRNGKLSIIAAALDERITAIISSSSGAGGACSYRFFSETQFGEGIELITRNFPDWLHPRLRFFAGRENKLPVDQPELIACIAPRPCLISTALNDDVESVWDIEQTYGSAQTVYSLLGAPKHLQLLYRFGIHGTHAEDIERYLDWLDFQFKRSANPLEAGQGISDSQAGKSLQTRFMESEPIYPTYADWQKASEETIEVSKYPAKGITDLLQTSDGKFITSAEQWKTKRETIRKRIEWGLGECPPAASSKLGGYGAEEDYLAVMLGRNSRTKNVEKRSVNFGNYVSGDLYYPTGADRGEKKIPAVIWLHPLSNSNGYVAGYRRGERAHLVIAQMGMAVFAFDQIGNGSRLQEIQKFYRRYPHWSLLGKTVQDTLAAVDALRDVTFIDSKKIFVLGYNIGAMAGLHAAALDDRIAGVVSVAGFTPMRLDTVEKGTGGVARWSNWLPLQPRLGAFVGQEARIPYDYHEVLAMIAPRLALVVEPKIDPQNTLADVKSCVAEAEKVYDLLGAKNRPIFLEVEDYNRFSPELQQTVYAKMKEIMDKM